jgi:hypothetical protein
LARETPYGARNSYGTWQGVADRPIKQIGKPKDPEKAALKAACESKGNKWDYETRRCIKVIKKSPATSGGAGGGEPPLTSGGVGEWTQDTCERISGGHYQPETGACTFGHSYGGGGGGGD